MITGSKNDAHEIKKHAYVLFNSCACFVQFMRMFCSIHAHVLFNSCACFLRFMRMFFAIHAHEIFYLSSSPYRLMFFPCFFTLPDKTANKEPKLLLKSHLRVAFGS